MKLTKIIFKIILFITNIFNIKVILIKPFNKNHKLEDNKFYINDIVFDNNYGFGKVIDVTTVNYACITVQFNTVKINITYYANGKHFITTPYNNLYNTNQYMIYTNINYEED